MNARTYQRPSYNYRKPNQAGFTVRAILICLVLFFCVAAVFHQVQGHAAADSSIIKSGMHGYCLDDYKDKATTDNMVSAWGCNNSSAQDWTVVDAGIRHGLNACLSVQNNSAAAGSKVVLNNCDDAPGQIWLQDKQGYFNPNSGLCLTAPAPNAQVIISSCSGLATADQIWQSTSKGGTATNTASVCAGTRGQRIACYAEKEWTAWQSGTISHPDLLSRYTDGAAYEEWCADFISYVYKEAGYPFTQAFGGWDENNANNIQNMGFTEHLASSGYIPKPGDVAYFDYNGGHVEIVVSGGKVPTFIYGDSATTDPTTGNGQMMANTITSDGAEGQVVYYLSPN